MMWIVKVPVDGLVYGPFLSEQAARDWAACNEVTDIDGLDRMDLTFEKLASPISEDRAAEYLWAAARVTDRNGTTYHLQLVDTTGGFERVALRSKSERAVDHVQRLLNAFPDVGGVAQEIMDQLGGEPAHETYEHYTARCEARDMQDAAHPELWRSEGFEWVHTGGGCSAWWRKITGPEPDRVEYEVYVHGDACVPANGEQFTIAIMAGDDDEPKVEKEFFDTGPRSVADAVAWAELWIDPKCGARVCAVCCQVWSPAVSCNCRRQRA